MLFYAVPSGFAAGMMYCVNLRLREVGLWLAGEDQIQRENTRTSARYRLLGTRTLLSIITAMYHHQQGDETVLDDLEGIDDRGCL